MENLKIIQTGGTIDKGYPKTVGGYAFEIIDSAAEKIFRQFLPNIPIEVCVVCRKDSQDIDDTDRERLVEECMAGDSRSVLVTHGTDTMIDTARYLAARLPPDRCVVLTGALKPHTFKDTDAELNVGVALGALQAMVGNPGVSGCGGGGVFVAMSGHIFTCGNVTRNAVTGVFERATSERTASGAASARSQ